MGVVKLVPLDNGFMLQFLENEVGEIHFEEILPSIENTISESEDRMASLSNDYKNKMDEVTSFEVQQKERRKKRIKELSDRLDLSNLLPRPLNQDNHHGY